MSHRAKLARASVHIDEVKILAGRYLDSDPYAYDGHYDRRTGEFIARAVIKHRVPPEVSIAIGDALFNMRSALDHIAWELAPDGTDSTRLEFPIFRYPADFARWRERKIGLLKKQAQEVIESLQPYHGESPPYGHPLWLLHQLNIVDKHRKLLAAGAISNDGRLISVNGTMNGHPGLFTFESGAFDDGSVLFRGKMPPDAYGAKMRVEVDASYSVAFAKEGPAHGAPISTLSRIHDHIRDVVFPALEALL